ncbi:MAG: hypothetical protein QF842_04540 [Candidatus Marinimicrobia bacterium]|jgi:hypothetical protein|nr:hypothetical protein [Candidatus Neomarinimicrobiota bacterium]MDP6612087.1 hypothetical protein [Candidatus Neomarinimicrobiota bacterium]|tara:strand:- start:4928 stop:5338 length:411 start_codon:yes stop_codon:yes gene_type:complete
MKKLLTFFLLAFILFSCVGPPDPDHGLVKNLPAVINTPSAFSFSVRGDSYTFEENITLSFSLPAGKSVVSTLIVTDWKGKDTTYVHLEEVNGSEIYKYTVMGNGTSIDQSVSTAPKKAIIKGNKFTGILAWTVTAN